MSNDPISSTNQIVVEIAGSPSCKGLGFGFTTQVVTNSQNFNSSCSSEKVESLANKALAGIKAFFNSKPVKVFVFTLVVAAIAAISLASHGVIPVVAAIALATLGIGSSLCVATSHLNQESLCREF